MKGRRIMKTVRIGNNHVSAVALGCMRMGGLAEHGVDAIMYAAMESGICYFDHADFTETAYVKRSSGRISDGIRASGTGSLYRQNVLSGTVHTIFRKSTFCHRWRGV